MEGPTIEKARCCLIEERARGTKSSAPAEDRKTRRLQLYQKADDKDHSDRPRHSQGCTATVHQTKTATLLEMRCGTESQYNTSHI